MSSVGRRSSRACGTYCWTCRTYCSTYYRTSRTTRTSRTAWTSRTSRQRSYDKPKYVYPLPLLASSNGDSQALQVGLSINSCVGTCLEFGLTSFPPLCRLYAGPQATTWHTAWVHVECVYQGVCVRTMCVITHLTRIY